MKEHPDTIKLKRLKGLLNAFVNNVNAELELSSREQFRVKAIVATDDEPTFTTYEVAKFCKVFHTSVIGWANKGMIESERTPGGHRRFTKSAVVAFMRKHGKKIPSALL